MVKRAGRTFASTVASLALLSGCGIVVGLRGDYVLGDASVDGALDGQGADGADGSMPDAPADTSLSDTADVIDTGIPDVPPDVPAQCLNMTQDINESDVDCGGTSPCPRCTSGRKCMLGTDCVSGMCNGVNNKCK
jgi:hypothetical protein